MPAMRLLHRRELLGAGGGLGFFLPGLIGDAVDRPAALVLAHGNALCVGGVLHPVGQAVAAEAGEIHQVDVLDIGPFTQMVDETPEGGGFDFGSGFVVDGHGRYPAVVEYELNLSLVTDSAIS